MSSQPKGVSNSEVEAEASVIQPSTQHVPAPLSDLDGATEISTVAATVAAAGGLPGATMATTVAGDVTPTDGIEKKTSSSSSSSSTSNAPSKPPSPASSKTGVIANPTSNHDHPTLSSIAHDELLVHRSSLPLFLYLLSFAPPLPSPLRSPRAFVKHPGVLYIVGTLAAIVAGMALPSLDLIYGVVWTNALTREGVTPEEITRASNHAGWLVVMVGTVSGFFSWLFLTCFNLASYQLCNGLRYAYVSSVVSQDISYFDNHGPGEVAAHSGKEIAAIRAGFGEKFAFLIWSSSTLVTAVTIGFNTQARVVATLLSLVPFVLGMFAIVGYVTDRIGVPALKLEGRVSSFLETALGSMRVVQSFNMQSHLLKRLDGEMLQRLSSYDRSIALMRGVGGAGALYFALNVCYALAFFVIGRFIRLYNVEIGSSITAFWNVINFLFALTSVLPHVSAIATALTAMKHMRRAIEREPRIDVRDVRKGLRPIDFAASLELRGVTMAYPSRPGVAVLNDVSIDVPAAKVTALVGPSGSGKSSIIHLLLREMDPEFANVPHPVDLKEKLETERKDRKNEEAQKLGMMGGLKKSLGLDKKKGGRSKDDGNDAEEVKEAPSTMVKDEEEGTGKEMQQQQQQQQQEKEETMEMVQGSGQVLFAGRDVRELNVRWLRSQIAIVNQHPQIFTATLLENVAEGLVGTDLLSHLGGDEESVEYREAVRQLVKEALIKAEAWEFVSRLPEGMDTKVNGGKAGLLSGGQKQRIALARALVRQPRVLILDEGTSALDSRSESKITNMLAREQRKRGMTVILIAHRLSTVRNADQIIVLKAGRVRDVGKHEELMNEDRQDTTYRNMVLTQQAIVRIDDDDEKEKKDVVQETMVTAPAAPQVDPPRSAAEKAAEDAKVLEEAKNAPPDPEPNQWIQFKAVFKPLAWSFLIGIALAIAGAANFPLSGWMFGEALPNLATRANFWALWFFILAIAAGIVISAESFMLEHASQRLMRQLRVRAFTSLVKQEIGFFDQPRVASGALTGAVSTHPANVGAATGLVMSQIILSCANLCGSMALGIALNWKLGLATCLPPVCVLLVAGWSNARYIESYEMLVSGPEASAASFISESVDAVQELIALGLERSRLARFRKQATAADDGLKAGKHLMIGAAGFAVGQATVLWNCGLIFHYGGKLLSNGDITIEKLYSVTEAAFIATFTAGRVLSFGGDIGRARASFRALSTWFERKPRIAVLPESLGGSQLSSLKDGSFAKGSFEFRNVEMRYPQRPQHRALDDLNLVIEAGKTVCFCGPSGGGKSSIFQLIERFYEPSRGTITLGGVDLRSMPPEELRRHVAIVSQDPTLFDGSIRWNLALGSDDPSSVTDEQIEEACRQAMILDFIKGLPQGFDTNCGIRGADMSGGQRQRLCIARAIIRNPSILLLDEATSALDAEAEASCIAALERASKGRTTITIAHRLSTIRNADVIHVLEEGRIVESGTHNQLLRLEGRYKELVEAQL